MTPFANRLWLLVLIAVLPTAAGAKRSICTATLNSHQERDLFKTRLPKKDFDFVELTEFQPKDPSVAKDAWFDNACAAGVRCDVLVISGHFGGEFFGDSGLGLKLDPMENQSCKKTCQGIVSRPKEVFLFGCNTLTTKDKDRRTPEEYYRRLVDEGNSPERARQVVQDRYGSLGDSNRNRMRRIFTGVPRIYGFDSVGPAGSSVTRFLDAYLNKTGDYAKHLESIEGRYAVASLEKASARAQTPATQTISSVFRSTAFSQCQGLDPTDPEIKLKEKLCPLFDDKIALKSRINYARELLRGGDTNALVPSVLAFVRAHEVDASGNPELTAALHEFGADPKVRAVVDALAKDANSSPMLRLSVDHFKYIIGMLKEEDLLRTGREVLTPMFKNLTKESVGAFCDLATSVGENRKITLSADDIDAREVESPVGAAALYCVKTEDPRLTAAVIRSYARPNKDAEIDRIRAYNLLEMPGEEAAKVRALSPFVESKDATLKATANTAVFAYGAGAARGQAFSRLLNFKDQDYAINQVISNADVRGEDLGTIALDTAIQDPKRAFAGVQMMGNLVDANSPLWAKALKEGDDQVRAAAFYQRVSSDQHDGVMTNWMLDRMAKGGLPDSLLEPVGKYAAGVRLNPAQVARAVETIERDPAAPGAALLRLMIKDHAGQPLTTAQRTVVGGPARGYACHPSEGTGYTCSVVEESL